MDNQPDQKQFNQQPPQPPIAAGSNQPLNNSPQTSVTNPAQVAVTMQPYQANTSLPGQKTTNVMPGQTPQENNFQRDNSNKPNSNGLKIFTIIILIITIMFSTSFVGYFLNFRFNSYRGPGSEFLPLMLAAIFSYRSPIGIAAIVISSLISIYFIFYIFRYKPKLLLRIGLIFGILILISNVGVVVYSSVLLNNIRSVIIQQDKQRTQQINQLLQNSTLNNK